MSTNILLHGCLAEVVGVAALVALGITGGASWWWVGAGFVAWMAAKIAIRLLAGRPY